MLLLLLRLRWLPIVAAPSSEHQYHKCKLFTLPGHARNTQNQHTVCSWKEQFLTSSYIIPYAIVPEPPPELERNLGGATANRMHKQTHKALTPISHPVSLALVPDVIGELVPDLTVLYSTHPHKHSLHT